MLVIICHIVAHEEDITEKLDKFAKQLLLLRCELYVGFSKQEHIGVAQEAPAANTSSVKGVVNGVRRGNIFTVHAPLNEILCPAKIHVGTDTHIINLAEAGCNDI